MAKSDLLHLFTNELNDSGKNYTAGVAELETMAKDALPASSRKAGMGILSKFKSAVVGGPKSIVTGKLTLDNVMTAMRDNFGAIDDPQLMNLNASANSAQFEAALHMQANGLKIDKVRLGNIGAAYKDQKKFIDGMTVALADVHNVTAHAIPQMIDAVTAETAAIQGALQNIAGKGTGNTVAEIKSLVGGDYAKLIEEVTEKGGAKSLVIKGAAGGENIILGELTGGKLTSDIGADVVRVAQREYQVAGTALIRNQTQYMEEAKAFVVKAEENLVKEKALFDQTGKLLGKGPVYTGAAAEAAAKAGAVVTTEAGKIAGVIDAEAAKLGVIGEEAMKDKGFFASKFANIKANFNVYELKNENGVIKAVENGSAAKFGKVAGAGAGAILVGYGLKDLGKATGIVAGDVDADGKEVAADTGTLIKSVAELGAGAVLAYFTLLKGGKAAGHVL